MILEGVLNGQYTSEDHLRCVLGVEASVVLTRRIFFSLSSVVWVAEQMLMPWALSLEFPICPLTLAKNTKAHIMESYYGSCPISYTTKFCLFMEITERQCFFSLLFCKNNNSDLFSSLCVL